ncbi:carboxypeptidase regulatory-like domain-containing protein, partial [Actinoplanes sp. NPDC051633]|uniref:carboxypeptidase-like regulatory domain-containing protein n=1 Tax=Actinoplanes sp. NPDC051633 TaxID=3155670 RepID=UPI00344A544B
MTTHLRARAAQAGALVALVGGLIAIGGAPAWAADPTVQVVSLSSTDVASGGRTTLKYSITNNNQLGESDNQIRINVSGMTCAGDCSPSQIILPGQTRDFTANLTAPAVNAGANREIQIRITANANNGRAEATETVTVRGPEKPQQVTAVTGKVKDAKNKSVSGAQVVMQDSADHRYETTSNGDGEFTFRSSDSKPIAPGSISVGAGKDDFEPAAVSVNGAAGKTVTVTLTVTAKAVTPSATPSTAEASAPADEETDAATDPATEDAATDTKNTAGEQDDDGSLLFIILGGLLVAAGVGAIVLVLMRRRNSGGDDDDDAGLPGAPVPPARGGGGYGDATRVAAPVGGRADDATMVAGAGPGAGAASLANAPTMIHRAVPADDEFPDPYGAPLQPQQPANPYANPYANPGPATQTYGAAAVPAQAAPGGGYDDQYYDDGRPQAYYGQEPYGGAPEPQRFDEPTGMYRPEEYAEPPAPAAGTYGRAGAPPQQEWDAPAPQSGGAYGGGTYGGGAGGYDQGGGYAQGYDQGGYDQGY